MKMHMEDIRLANNAGMEFPVCQVNAKLLDLDKGHWNTTGDQSKVDCKHCKKAFAKRYAWAVRKPKGVS